VTRIVTGSVHSFDLSIGGDGPGTRFVTFLAGCPLRCRYCHSPDTWTEHNGRRTGVDDLMVEVDKYRRFITVAGGGLTVSGGEPLLQPAFTGAILRAAKDRGLHTALTHPGRSATAPTTGCSTPPTWSCSTSSHGTRRPTGR
jgi:pyruvate formate lyase activating enzyme